MRGGGDIAVAGLHADHRPDLKETWRLLVHDSPLQGTMNMGWDIALWRWSANSGVPVLRFYTWFPPTLSLGHAQDPDAVVNWEGCQKHGVDVVRRPTGGRAVLHHEELTYTLTGRLDAPGFPSKVQDLYSLINEALDEGLRRAGIPCRMWAPEVTPAPSPKTALPCFAAPGPGEIAVEGKKIVGSAMRLDGTAFLQHGSILMDFDLPLQKAVQKFPFTTPVAKIRDFRPAMTTQEMIPFMTEGFKMKFGARYEPFPEREIDPADLDRLSAESTIHPPRETAFPPEGRRS